MASSVEEGENATVVVPVGGKGGEILDVRQVEVEGNETEGCSRIEEQVIRVKNSMAHSGVMLACFLWVGGGRMKKKECHTAQYFHHDSCCLWRFMVHVLCMTSFFYCC